MTTKKGSELRGEIALLQYYFADESITERIFCSSLPRPSPVGRLHVKAIGRIGYLIVGKLGH